MNVSLDGPAYGLGVLSTLLLQVLCRSPLASRSLIADDLAVVRIRDIRGQSDLLVGLGEQIFRSLCVTAQLVLVIALGGIDFLVGLDDITLGGSQIAMSMRIDVYDWRLGERRGDAGKRCVEGGTDEQAFLCHGMALPGAGFGE